MINLKKRITKALIRLCECAGWSAPVLFANLQRQGSSRRGPNKYLTYNLLDEHTRVKNNLKQYVAGAIDNF